MSDKERLLAGQLIRGPITRTAFTKDSPLAGGDSIAIAGPIGSGLENLCVIWNGAKVDRGTIEQIVTTRPKVIRQLVSLADFNPPSPFQALGLPESTTLDGQQVVLPANQDVRLLFQLVEQVLHSQFLSNAFQRLEFASYPEAVDHRVRYPLLGALAASREIARPSLSVEPGHLHQDFRFIGQEGLELQFDAIVTHEPFSPPITRIESLLQYLGSAANPDWGVIQIKLFTDDRYNETGALTTVIPRHHREARRQLVSLALAVGLDEGSPLTFPKSIYFVYLRPTKPTIIHEVKIDFGYLRAWSLELEIRILNLIKESKKTNPRLTEIEEELTTLDKLKDFIDGEAAVREILEGRSSEPRPNLGTSFSQWHATAHFLRPSSMLSAEEMFQPAVAKDIAIAPPHSTEPQHGSSPQKTLHTQPRLFPLGDIPTVIKERPKSLPREPVVVYRAPIVSPDSPSRNNSSAQALELRAGELAWLEQVTHKRPPNAAEPPSLKKEKREKKTRVKIDPEKIGMTLEELTPEIYLDIVDIYDRTLGGSGKHFAHAEEVSTFSLELEHTDGIERRFHSRLGYAKFWIRSRFCHNDPRGLDADVVRFDAVIYNDDPSKDKRARQLEGLFTKRVAIYLIERDLAVRLD